MPANKTDLYQTLDLSVNKSSKWFLPDKYQTWYADRVAAQLGRRVAPQSRRTTFGYKAITCKMGSRILSPYAAQRWKENRQERVSKRPRQRSVLSGHSPSELR